MSLRIAHNLDALKVGRYLTATNARLETSMRRISSGFRINSASDDAAGLGISERMRAQIAGLAQANRNIQDGMGMLQVMDGLLSEVHSILLRARDLAVQHNNGTLDFNAKIMIKEELATLSDEIGRIEGGASYSGIALMQSATAVVTLQVGANGGEVIAISLVDLLGPTAGSLVRPNTFFTVPWSPADIAGFDMHIDDVSKARARLGAVQNRLEYAMAANTNQQENLMSAESRIRDVDLASEMTRYTRLQVMQQSATAMLAQANHSSYNVLDLLRPG
jgi:flagellin